MKRKKKVKNKKILIGICGSISAWKVCDLIRKLKKNNFEVKCIITPAGEKFITSLTLQTISENKVYKDMFEEIQEFQPKHISLADWADLILVAPATATTIGK
ncbi:MAG: flavoprotein, partial [Endomicrobiia bacterium]